MKKSMILLDRNRELKFFKKVFKTCLDTVLKMGELSLLSDFLIILSFNLNKLSEERKMVPDSTEQSRRRPKHVTLTRLRCTWNIENSQDYIPWTSFTYG
jgi:hypothetical protein